ncbi:TetR/AcrR family transcriptional regulator [Caenibacillus caldisaponilyticus]|uniref:TetR/AcrR family transcriptional regulator n=1 Tax=Caenibacillus caldisaponilyticus TaxID=1674942 RepID=UPI0009887460|nr:TetR/AcrR family transcriptional regulator [Caenibacillus caldisaponilyticus]
MNKEQRRPPGRPKVNEQNSSTRDLILKTALELFLDRGFPLVSIDNIAQSSGVTKATVYYYFSSKAELFTEAIVRMMDRITNRIQSILSEDLPLKTRLLKMTHAHLKATYRIDLDHFMQGAGDSLSEQQIDRIRLAEARMYEAVEQAFIEAMDRKEIPKINPEFATQIYLALLKVGNHRGKDHRPMFSSVEETARHIICFFWNGLVNTEP